jgi:hypothetical protein
MAVNKSKRSIHLAQPQPQHAKTSRAADPKPERPNLNVNQEPTEQMPVRAHVYRTIADMNGGFEQVIEVLQALQKIKHLPADSIKGIENQTARIRAEANRDLMAVLSERELANASHFQRLCMEPGRDSPQLAERT